MRVDDANPAGVPASQPPKTQDSRELDRAGQGKPPVFGWTAGTDQVDLSRLAGRLSGWMIAMAAERSERVERLAQLYAAGSYQVDSRALSRAILAELTEAGSSPS